MKITSFLLALAALLLICALRRDEERTREMAGWETLTKRAVDCADCWRALYDRAQPALFPPGPELRIDPDREDDRTTLVAR